MILHTFTASPFTSKAIENAVSYLKDDDAVLLTNDAVYLTNQRELLEQVSSQCKQVYMLQEDSDARGISNVFDNIKNIDYTDFVKLTLAAEKVIAW